MTLQSMGVIRVIRVMRVIGGLMLATYYLLEYNIIH